MSQLHSLSIDECGDLMFEWLQSHCNSKKSKEVAQAVGYKYSIFSPQRKIRVMEELTFLYTSVAIYGLNMALSDETTAKEVIDAFLEKLHRKLFDVVVKDDVDFSGRYSERLSGYFHLFRSGGDGIGAAGDFMVGLFGTPNARINNLPGLLHLAPKIESALLSINHMLQLIEITGLASNPPHTER